MTLECEVVFRILRIHIVDSNSSFNTAQSKSSRTIGLLVSEDTNASVLLTDLLNIKDQDIWHICALAFNFNATGNISVIVMCSHSDTYLIL